MIFHVLHGPVHALMQPLLEFARIFIESNGPGDATMIETQFAAPAFDPICLIVF
jgi:hypothetical protein